jgi:hypothetical protein
MPDGSSVIFDYCCSTVCVLQLFVSNPDFEVQIPLIDCHGTDLSAKVIAECPMYNSLNGEVCNMKTMYNFLEAHFTDIMVQPYTDKEVIGELMEFIYDYSSMEQLEA